jgi:hypothetical protein
VGGNFENSLFLNSVSELLMMIYRDSMSFILHRELARVLLRLRDLLGLLLLKISFFLDSFRGTCSST